MMSGGSFNYLYAKDASDLLAGSRDEELEVMADALAHAGAQDAAQETRRLLAIVQEQRARIQARIDRLSALWQAMEWWKSNDTSAEDFQDELARWKAAPPVARLDARLEEKP